MGANAALENIFGTIGTMLWCIQIIPQIIVNYRRKDVEGLSIWLMFIWSAASIFLGAYVVAQSINVPIMLQPQLFGALAAVCWVQCLYYGSRRLSRTRSACLLVGYLAVFAGLEVAFVYAIRAGSKAGTDAPLLVFGIISAALLLGGLIPQYLEIYHFREVIGLSLTFMSMDLLGGVFCTLSLVFKAEFDALAAVNYAGIVVLDGGILVLAAILNPRAKRRRKRLQDLEATAAQSEGHQNGTPDLTAVFHNEEHLAEHALADTVAASLDPLEKADAVSPVAAAGDEDK